MTVWCRVEGQDEQVVLCQQLPSIVFCTFTASHVHVVWYYLPSMLVLIHSTVAIVISFLIACCFHTDIDTKFKWVCVPICVIIMIILLMWDRCRPVQMYYSLERMHRVSCDQHQVASSLALASCPYLNGPPIYTFKMLTRSYKITNITSVLSPESIIDKHNITV